MSSIPCVYRKKIVLWAESCFSRNPCEFYAWVCVWVASAFWMLHGANSFTALFALVSNPILITDLLLNIDLVLFLTIFRLFYLIWQESVISFHINSSYSTLLRNAISLHSKRFLKVLHMDTLRILSLFLAQKILFLLFFYHINIVWSNPDAKRLYDDLMSQYNRIILPRTETNELVNVSLGLKLTQIIDLVSFPCLFLVINNWKKNSNLSPSTI